MAFVFEKDEKLALAAGNGGSLGTGIHKVKILGAYLTETKGGNNQIDLELESTTGGKATIYNMCIDEKWKPTAKNPNGAENYDYSKWQELAAVAGMKTGETVACKRKDFNGVEKDAIAFTELANKVITIALQIKLDVNNKTNKKTTARTLQRTFFETGHSLAEKTAATEPKQSVTLASSLKDYETKAYKAWSPSADAAGTDGQATDTVEEVPGEDLI